MDGQSGKAADGLAAVGGVSGLLSSLYERRETRNLFVFTCALAGFMLVQGLYGMRIDSIGAPRDNSPSCARTESAGMPPHCQRYRVHASTRPPPHPLMFRRWLSALPLARRPGV
jgi:hypothetical protein